MAYQYTNPANYDAHGQTNAAPFHLSQAQRQQPPPISSAPFPSYAQPAPDLDGQMNTGPRQPYHVNHNSGSGINASIVPDSRFKKPQIPSKPEHQHTQHAQAPPNNSSNASPSAASSAPTATAYSPQGPKPISNPSVSYSATPSMTAPPTASPTQSTSTSEAPSQATDSTPQVSKLSPLDQERVDALLNVNNLLLQEVQVLQKIGLKTAQPGNPQSPQQANPANASSPKAKPEGSSTDAAASGGATQPTNSTSSTPTTTTPTIGVPQQTYNQKKFVEYMKRLQSNIMFLVSMSDASKQRQKPPYPSHLEILPDWLAEGMKLEDKPQLEELKEGYGKLRELWPDWKPIPPGPNPQQQQAQAQAQAQAPNHQQQASAHQIIQPQAQSNISGRP